MKAAFVHELQFVEDTSGKLYIRGYDTAYWERYLRYFDELYVVGRKKKIKEVEVKGLNLFCDERMKLYEVPSIHSPRDLIKNFGKAKRLMHELAQLVDCVITRQPGFFSNRILSECKKNNVPYLIEMVGCPWDSMWNHSFYGKIMAPMVVFQTKKNLQDAQYVVYVTESFLQKRYPSKGVQTNCSNVTLPIPEEHVLENRLKHQEGLAQRGKIVIGTTAAVDVRYKGQQFVMEALAELKRRGVSCYEYHMAGGGDQTYLKKVAADLGVSEQVVFHGSLTHDKVFEFLDGLDIYVQPSLQEGLPRALIEAMSRGLPCFGAHTGGIPELLEPQFVYKKRRKRLAQMVKIIMSFTADIMREQSVRNYHEAAKYEAGVIDARRRELFERFIKEAKR